MEAAPPPVTEAEKSTEASRRSEHAGLARVGVRLVILATAVFATAAAIVFLVPEQNDYNLGIDLKHRRLAQYDTRKIVLVGGSNLSYGVDSKLLQSATGCPVVNMGMNGYFGVRYMLEEVKQQIDPSDVVVLSFEYDNLFKSVDGSPTSHLAIIKALPRVFSYLSLKQKLYAIGAIPTVAQTKILRLIDELITNVKEPIAGKSYQGDPSTDLNIIESLKSFTPEGDIVGHLGAVWPFDREAAVVPEGATIDPEMIALMQDFAADMKKRGVPVIVSYTPFMREAYDELEDDLARFHAMIKSSPPLIAPSPPSSFVFDQSLFFDTVYHLNDLGRPLRTQKMADDLLATLGERARCPQQAKMTGEPSR
jgi:hypothetical protein